MLLLSLGTIFSITAGILRPLISIPYGKVVAGFDSAKDPEKNHQNIVEAVTMLVGFGVVLSISSYGSMCCWMLAGENQTKQRIRELYFHAVLRQDQSWFDLAELESLNSRLSSDTYFIQEGISDKVGLIIKNITQMTSGFVMAFIFGWRLSLILIAVLPLLGLSGYIFSSVIKSQTVKAQDAYSKADSFVEQAISGIHTVASFSLQSRFVNLYNQHLKIAYQAGVQKAIKIGICIGATLFIGYSTDSLGLWYGARLISQESMSGAAVVQAFFSFIIGAASIGNRYIDREIGPEYKALVEAQVAAEKIFATIDRVPVMGSSSKSQDKDMNHSSFRGVITFCDVRFSYPSRPNVYVLNGVNLQIPSGKTVALVGASGSGKSTLIQLVQRFYDPSMGRILFDGVDLRDLDVKWLRNQIGVVGQEPVLFDDTIRNNIALGALHRDPTQSEIEEVCIKADCHEWIASLPHGYDTRVGEIGSQLSGGQKQRIAIARALIRNPTILLLDEATSALDTQSEKIVQEALKTESKHRSTIIIAHRLSTIRDADLIVVMDNGKIIEQGTHIELIARDGVYNSFVRKQQLIANKDRKAELVRDFAPEYHGERHSDSNQINENQSTMVDQDMNLNVVKVSAKEKPITRVLWMMSPEWTYVIMSLFGAIIKGAAFPIDGLLFGHAFNALSQSPYIVEESTKFWVLMYFAMAFIGFLATFFEEGVAHFCGERLVRRVRSEVFSNILRQEIAFFDHPSHATGALTSCLAKNAAVLQDLPNILLIDGGRMMSAAIIGFIIMFSYGWKMSLILLPAMPLYVFALIFQVKALEGFSGRVNKGYRQAGKIVGEAIHEIRTVASLGIEDVFENKYKESCLQTHRAALNKAYIASIGFGLSQGFHYFIYAIGFFIGARFIRSGEMASDQVSVVMFTVVMCSLGMSRFSAHMPRFIKAMQAALILFELSDKATAMDPERDGKYRGISPGTAELRHVNFTYPMRPDAKVFHNICMDIHRNKKIALVGPSGCGKSTIISLLLRWYDCDVGKVLVEGVDVREWQLEAMRQKIGLVGQEPVLFNLTVRENILFGSRKDREVTQEEIEKAAKVANIHQFISSLPNGYHTRVGEKGSQLSGGQKQRIAIARALLRNPDILLLDEATSALDTESEKLVQDALDKAMIGRTTIVITHRLSTVQDSDNIIVMKDGAIVEMGHHSELIAKTGIYYKLAHQQELNN
ncbi:uncharacterized protein VTP21DRAFT_5566 [Calcarisporiella thermophila]|uniref:uncharacterized protein n=1 Tax=Calcarisporiella thermophila TaxID=911321 RepID=UPI0037439217